MKVHKYQIAVMWLFLNVLYHSVPTEMGSSTAKNVKRLNGLHTITNSPFNIRPPPLGG